MEDKEDFFLGGNERRITDPNDNRENLVAYVNNLSKRKLDRVELVKEARRELVLLNSIKELVKDNDLACTIEIYGIKISLCKNDSILPAIEHNIQEIQKCLDFKSNDWE